MQQDEALAHDRIQDAFRRFSEAGGIAHELREDALLAEFADFKRAIASFDQAVALDASYGRANAALAATYWEIWRRLWHESVGLARWHEARANAEAHLSTALESPTSLAHRVSAEMFAQSGWGTRIRT